MEKYKIIVKRTVFNGTQFVKRTWNVSMENISLGTIEETIFFDADGFETSSECVLKYPSGTEATISSYQEGISRLLALTY